MDIDDDDGFNSYLELCGWKRVPDTESDQEETVQTEFDGIGDNSDDEYDQFTVSEFRIRTLLSNRSDINNDEEVQYLRDMERRLFNAPSYFKYIHAKQPGTSLKKFKEYEICHSSTDEGVPYNCNDLWENYVKKKDLDHVLNFNISPMVSHVVNKFDDMLEVNARRITPVNSVQGVELLYGERFRGNLLTTSQMYGVTFLGYRTQLLMRFDKEQSSMFDFVLDLDSDITSNFERLNAINWENPHHINNMKICDMVFKPFSSKQEMLALVLDDSMVILFNIQDLIRHIKSKSAKASSFSVLSNPSLYKYSYKGEEYEIMPYFQYHLTSSVWGVDMKDSILVVSDNSHKVTAFDFNANQIYVSGNLSHNIPCVSLMEGGVIGAITYDGVQYILEIKHSKIEVIDKVKVLNNGWSCVFYPKSKCLSVNSFAQLTGNPQIEDEYLPFSLADTLITKNESLRENCFNDGNFGLAGLFHRIKISSNHSTKSTSASEMCLDNSQMQRRAIVHKLKDRNWCPYLLFSGTESEIGMWHLPYLLNCCMTVGGDIFPDDDYVSNVLQINPRINMILPILDLQCILVVSNGGYVELMRCVEYRGIYSFRREWILINIDWVVLGVTASPENGGYLVRILIQNYTIFEVWVGLQDNEKDDLVFNFL